jgi:hypothetical protein
MECFDLLDLKGLAPVDGVAWAVSLIAFAGITPQDLKQLCSDRAGVVMGVKGVCRR